MSASRNWIAAAALACIGTAASAHTRIAVQIATPVVVVPAPVVAYMPVQPARVWVPGHWEWQGDGHVWVPGGYVVRHHGYAMRDGDRDGVPDRFDRAPFNPYRY